MMFKEDFIPYNEAIIMKNLGFDEHCLGFYTDNETLAIDPYWMNSNFDATAEMETANEGYAAAATYGQAFRWIRKHYHFDANIIREPSKNPDEDTKDFYVEFFDEVSKKIISHKYNPQMWFKTREEAETAALKELLTACCRLKIYDNNETKK